MAIYLNEMGWPNVADYLERDDRVILPVGSTEQHGRHLPLGTDLFAPSEMARRLSDRTGVVVAPALPYGMSLHHLGFPGSVSLRPETLIHVLEDILRSLYRHGFRRVFLINGHGGNIPSLEIALLNVMTEFSDLEVRLRNWWDEPLVDQVLASAASLPPGGHADALETSVILATLPDTVHLDRARYSNEIDPSGILTEWLLKKDYVHGVIGGDPRMGTAALGEKVVQAVVEAYAAELQAWLG